MKEERKLLSNNKGGIMVHYFDKYVAEANTFINELSDELGHPDDPQQTIRLLKATLHTLRDRMTISESLDLVAQLPMMLKGLFVEQWKYHEKPPLHFEDIEGFAEAVKNEQARLGAQKINWEEPTADLIKIILQSLREHYLSDGQAIHVLDQMPPGVRELF